METVSSLYPIPSGFNFRIMYSFIISGKVSALAVVSCPLFFEAVSSVFCAITDEEIIVAINQNAMCLFFIMP